MLDKAIEHGKEHRKPYKGSKAVDRTCRNHGSCDWCRENRTYQQLKAEEAAEDAIEDWKDEADLYDNDIQ